LKRFYDPPWSSFHSASALAPVAIRFVSPRVLGTAAVSFYRAWRWHQLWAPLQAAAATTTFYRRSTDAPA